MRWWGWVAVVVGGIIVFNILFAMLIAWSDWFNRRRYRRWLASLPEKEREEDYE